MKILAAFLGGLVVGALIYSRIRTGLDKEKTPMNDSTAAWQQEHP